MHRSCCLVGVSVIEQEKHFIEAVGGYPVRLPDTRFDRSRLPHPSRTGKGRTAE
jgi:hypothetical protein